ncbi:fused response regulator/phosphatase [Pararcticibacter amylolyticus]|uniref:Response regulator n=1 Tax=Pararcticibacter amylolyticus TaxID=2173175 RepID=A0A2U2PKE6_9SPHI|nr:fused response regulator/phosphatase [Pararcticibacter amylolyticus]PWG81798.1 response regulator [Pararcticibacter amylolyticus]
MPDSHKKILLVDDDRIIITLICKILFRKGFQCLKADSVDMALKILEKEKPDIILSDYSMPEKDGFEFRQILMADKRLKDIPFLFFTSFSDTELMKKGLDMQAIDYIDKNTPIPLVVSKIVNILDTIRKQHEQSIYELGAAARALNLRSVPESTPENELFKLDFLYHTYQNYPGGDFIDFPVTEDGYTFIILGDVMGKKWGAWFFSFNYLSYIRSAIRLCVSEGDISTASIVHKINRVVNMDPVLKDVLSTLSLLMIEPKSGNIHYTGAGDLPLILYKRDLGTVTEIRSSGLMLGIMPDGLYDEQILDLSPGDQLIIVSDGMIDYREDGGTVTDYKGFVGGILPLMGRMDTFELIRKKTFGEGEQSEISLDDQSLLFLERKSLSENALL